MINGYFLFSLSLLVFWILANNINSSLSILQFLQIFLTDARTFMCQFSQRGKQACLRRRAVRKLSPSTKSYLLVLGKDLVSSSFAEARSRYRALLLLSIYYPSSLIIQRSHFNYNSVAWKYFNSINS